jgi:hypothetical protein
VAPSAALTSGFVVAFGVSAVLSLAGALIGLFGLPRIRPRSAHSGRVVATESA